MNGFILGSTQFCPKLPTYVYITLQACIVKVRLHQYIVHFWKGDKNLFYLKVSINLFKYHQSRRLTDWLSFKIYPDPQIYYFIIEYNINLRNI